MSYLNAGRLGLVGAPTYSMLRDATQSTLFEILDRNQIPYDFNKAENVLTLRDRGIVEMTGFLDPAVHARFGLPDR